MVQALIDGDERAWRDFLVKYGPGVRRCITSVTSRFRGSVSPADEEEIFSSFCLRLLSNDKSRLHAFDPRRGAALGTWLGMMAIQTTYDFLRRRRREAGRDQRAVLDVLCAPGPDPLELYQEQERAGALRRLLGQVSEQDRKLFEALCSDSFEPDVLARELGVKLSTIYTKKHKLIGRLARLAEAEAA